MLWLEVGKEIVGIHFQLRQKRYLLETDCTTWCILKFSKWVELQHPHNKSKNVVIMQGDGFVNKL